MYLTQKNGLPRGVKNISGMRFGKLVAVAFKEIREQPCGLAHAMWECVCDCGEFCVVSRASLREGATKSCGCYRKELAHKRVKHGVWSSARIDHNKRHMYFSWRSMKARCDNPLATGFKNYGGRGISYNPKWKTFEGFYEDMGASYRPLHSLDRMNVNGNYTKENCRWATDLEQNNNTRFNTVLEHNGIRRTIAQWSRLTKIPRHTLRTRISKGFPTWKVLGFNDPS